jgi:hypothetical protein
MNRITNRARAAAIVVAQEHSHGQHQNDSQLYRRRHGIHG